MASLNVWKVTPVDSFQVPFQVLKLFPAAFFSAEKKNNNKFNTEDRGKQVFKHDFPFF